MTPKTVVFGLDGAHFELIEPWIEAGHLPHIERVIEGGVTADLESVLPPVTSPNWKAYATGKNPGKIGIFWWENIDTANQRVHYPSERKHRNTEFWEIIAEDAPVGVLGVPTTYPPKSVDGFLVAGAPDGQDSDYTHPPELEPELREQFDYRVLKHARIRDHPDVAAEEILDLIDTRFTVARELAADYDVEFLQATTFYLNSLHHFLWDDDHTRRAWELIDDHLGAFLDDGHNVVMMSDHGSTEIQTVFHINTWLEQQGYLRTETGTTDTLHRLGMNTDRIARVADLFGARRLAKQIAPQWLRSHIPNAKGEVGREAKGENIDWDETVAIASGQGPVYLTLDPGTDRYEQVRQELIESLSEMTDLQGKRIATAVHRGEDVYSGEFLDEGPDIVIDQRPGVHIPGAVGREAVFTDPTADGWRAENKRQGLFAATGPDFGTDGPETLSVLDLAPTLLHLHDRPVPADMDGQVCDAVFAAGSDPDTRSVSTRAVSERRNEVERIRAVARQSTL